MLFSSAIEGFGGWVKPKVKTFRFYRVFDSNKASGFRWGVRYGRAVCEVWMDRWAEGEGKGGVWV